MTERECFTQMQQLRTENEQVLKSYKSYQERAKALIETALETFMADHPDVQTLNFSHFLGSFRVVRGGEMLWPKDLTVSDPKLAKCLQALEDNLIGLADVATTMFSSRTVIVARDDCNRAMLSYY